MENELELTPLSVTDAHEHEVQLRMLPVPDDVGDGEEYYDNMILLFMEQFE